MIRNYTPAIQYNNVYYLVDLEENNAINFGNKKLSLINL